MATIELQEEQGVPSERVPAAPGVRVMDERGVRIQRRAVLILTLLPFAGLVAAVVTLWGTGLSALDATLFFTFYCISGIGVTVGYHRLLTHQSFETKPWLRNGFAIAGSLAVQGSVIAWVADHRRHHAFSDQPGDPHSPHLDEGPGLKGVMKGLWHAHMGWLFKDEETDPRRWAPDMLKDPGLVRVNKLFPLWVVISLTLPALIGFVVTQSFMGALTAYLWGSLARIFLLHHVTWSVNSICHFYGKRPYKTTDFSTNNWLLSLISFGESWHNNHHAFPSSAVHGIEKAQVDPSAGVIRVLRALRLARNVKEVPAKQLEAKKA